MKPRVYNVVYTPFNEFGGVWGVKQIRTFTRYVLTMHSRRHLLELKLPLFHQPLEFHRRPRIQRFQPIHLHPQILGRVLHGQ